MLEAIAWIVGTVAAIAVLAFAGAFFAFYVTIRRHPPEEWNA